MTTTRSISTGGYSHAIRRFQRLLERAHRTGLHEPTAASLCTVDSLRHPSVRTVLLKAVDEHGVVFYTNRESRKGRQLARNPHVALCCFWDPLMEQVIVEGRAAPVADAEADAYWASRPRQAQLGAWASLQSRPLPSRARLLARAAAYAVQFTGRPVPRPASWGGYRVLPDRIEFWKARPFRLNERIVYQRLRERAGSRWSIQLLYP